MQPGRSLHRRFERGCTRKQRLGAALDADLAAEHAAAEGLGVGPNTPPSTTAEEHAGAGADAETAEHSPAQHDRREGEQVSRPGRQAGR